MMRLRSLHHQRSKLANGNSHGRSQPRRSGGAPAFGGWARGEVRTNVVSPPAAEVRGPRHPEMFCIFLIQILHSDAFFGSENGHYQCFHQDPYALGEMKTVGKGCWMRPEGRKSRPKGFLRREQQAPPVRGSGERCGLSQWGSGRSPDHPKIFHSALRMASPDTIILYYCGSQKNEKFLIPFNLESITVHLVMLFDVFLRLYETKFTVGKWQVVVFTARKRRGRWVEFDTCGIPQAVPD